MRIHFLTDHHKSGALTSMQFGIDVTFAVEAPTQPECTRFLQSWRADRHGAGPWPARPLGPAEALSLLPQTFLIERAGPSWRYKLFGSALVKNLSVDLTGRLVPDVFAPAAADAMSHLLQKVAWRGAPIGIAGQWSTYTGLEDEFECIHAPLPCRGRSASAILGCLSVRKQNSAA
jgi:hypothetical protein